MFKKLIQNIFFSNKISELESSLKQPIVLMKNDTFPFFDTSISKKVDFVNSVSLLNIQSIKDFEKKTNKKIRFNLLYDKNKSLQKKIKIEQLRRETR